MVRVWPESDWRGAAFWTGGETSARLIGEHFDGTLIKGHRRDLYRFLTVRTGIFWLRLGYWVAGIADFVIAAIVLIPERMGVGSYVYPMGLMASVAFSWGVLLMVADRKPLERRWVVLPTMLVVALLGSVAVHAGYAGLIPMTRTAATAVVSIAVLLVLGFGYRRSATASLSA